MVLAVKGNYETSLYIMIAATITASFYPIFGTVLIKYSVDYIIVSSDTIQYEAEQAELRAKELSYFGYIPNGLPIRAEDDFDGNMANIYSVRALDHIVSSVDQRQYNELTLTSGSSLVLFSGNCAAMLSLLSGKV